jgi:rhodanese-related sulfurtransferase
VAQELTNMGFVKVYALKGGWNEWYKSGFPVEKK